MKKLILILITILPLLGFAQKGDHFSELIKVEVNGLDSTSEYPIQSDTLNKTFAYLDNNFSILFKPKTNMFGLELTNKTSNTVKIIWDDAAYVDFEGVTHKIYHSNIKFSDVATPQAPTSVMKLAKIVEIIAPINKLSYTTSLGWIQSDLFRSPQYQSNPPRKLGTLRFLIPIIIDNKKYEYVFYFDANWRNKTKKKKS